jgi:D-Ala-teichoic acid biosynthesis protein
MSLRDQSGKGSPRLSDRIARPWVRFVALTIYYLGILVGLVALYGAGDFSTPPFIYQNF